MRRGAASGALGGKITVRNYAGRFVDTEESGVVAGNPDVSWRYVVGEESAP